MTNEFVTCPCSATDCSTALGMEGKDADSPMNAKDIMEYLNKSHSAYFDGKMGDLEGELTELLGTEKGMEIVGMFFTALKDEVSGHFRYEECVTFPRVAALLAEGSGENRKKEAAEDFPPENGRAMETIRGNHGKMMEKLSDLKAIVTKYLPNSCDKKLRNKVLLHIYNLEQDLNRHIRIEDDVLIPLMKILEKHGR